MFNIESTQNFTGGRNQFQIRSLKHLLPVSGWIRLTGKGQGHITSETNEMKMSSEDPRLMETLCTVALLHSAHKPALRKSLWTYQSLGSSSDRPYILAYFYSMGHLVSGFFSLTWRKPFWKSNGKYQKWYFPKYSQLLFPNHWLELTTIHL